MTESNWPGNPPNPDETGPAGPAGTPGGGYGGTPAGGPPPPPGGYPGGGYPTDGPAAGGYAGPGEPGMAAAGWQPGETLVTEPRKSRRGVVVGAAAAVLAVVAAGSIYVATQLSGGGLQPEGLAPRTTFAFAKVDLDPAANQKLAARRYADHFPSAPKSDADDVFQTFVAEALKSSGEDLDYDRDVKPWLDKRVGIAGFTDRSGKAQAVGILQTKDEAAAREGLDRLAAKARAEGEDFAYELARGYAIIAETAAIADEVARTSENDSLASNERFDADVDSLTGDQVVVGWVDAKASFDAAKRSDPSLGVVPNALTSEIEGMRIVLGAHFANDYVEVEGFVVGGKATENYTNSEQKLLTELPADTVAAISVNNLGKTIEGSLSGVLAAGLGTEVDQAFEEIEAMTGLRVREDIFPALGSQTVLALGAFDPTGAALKAGLKAAVEDTTNAKEVGDRLTALAGQMGVPLEASVTGNTFYLTFGAGYHNKIKSEKGLGSSPLFTKAMGELGDNVAAAMYVDLSRIFDQLPMDDLPADVTALRAIGISSGRDGDKGYFRLRVVAGD